MEQLHDAVHKAIAEVLNAMVHDLDGVDRDEIHQTVVDCASEEVRFFCDPEGTWVPTR